MMPLLLLLLTGLSSDLERQLERLDAHDFAEVPAGIVMSLVSCGEEAIAPLRQRISDDFFPRRAAAIEALAYLGAEFPGEVLPALEQALRSDDRLSAVQAGQALAMLGQPAAKTVPDLVRMLEEESDLSRRTALMRSLTALGAGARETLVPLFEELLDDSDSWVRLTAEGGLAALVPERRMPLQPLRTVEDDLPLDRWIERRLADEPAPEQVGLIINQDLQDGLEYHNRWPLGSFPPRSNPLFFPPAVVARSAADGGGLDLIVKWSTTVFRCESLGVGVGHGMRVHKTIRCRILIRLLPGSGGPPTATAAAWRQDSPGRSWSRILGLEGRVVLRRQALDGQQNPALLDLRSARFPEESNSICLRGRSRLIPNRLSH